MRVEHISRWRTPASAYQRRRVGRAAIRTAWYEAGRAYSCYGQRGADYYVADRRLYVTTLRIGGKTWMVDDPPHWWAMQAHAEALSGRVLCAGLGLGLMVHAMHARPEITEIVVAEREPDVIALVGSELPTGKFQIVCTDFWGMTPENTGPVDAVLLDTYVGGGFEYFKQALDETRKILGTWGDVRVRVHGMPNPQMEEMARGIETAEKRYRNQRRTG